MKALFKNKRGFAFPTVLGTFVLVTSIAAGLFIMISNMTLMVSSDIETTETRFELRNIARLTFEAISKEPSLYLDSEEAVDSLVLDLKQQLNLDGLIDVDVSIIEDPPESNNFNGMINVTILNSDGSLSNESFSISFTIVRTAVSTGDFLDEEFDTTLTTTSSSILVDNFIDSYIDGLSGNLAEGTELQGPDYSTWLETTDLDSCTSDDLTICYLLDMNEMNDGQLLAVNPGSIDNLEESAIFTTDTSTGKGGTVEVTISNQDMVFIDGDLTLDMNSSDTNQRVLIGNFYITGDLNFNLVGGNCNRVSTSNFTLIGTFYIKGDMNFIDNGCSSNQRGTLTLGGFLDDEFNFDSGDGELRPTFLFVDGIVNIEGRGFLEETQYTYIYSSTFNYSPNTNYASRTFIEGTIRAANVLIQETTVSGLTADFLFWNTSTPSLVSPDLVINEFFGFTNDQLSQWGLPVSIASDNADDSTDGGFEIIELIED